MNAAPTFAEGLENVARREALRLWNAGDEEGALDLLAAASAIAAPAAKDRMARGLPRT